MIGAFAMGPVAGFFIELIKNLLHLMLKANEALPVRENWQIWWWDALISFLPHDL